MNSACFAKNSRTVNAFVIALLALAFAAASSTAEAQIPMNIANFDNASSAVVAPRPPGVITQGRDGNLYTASNQGGANSNNGGVVKLTPAGAITTVYNFQTIDGTSCSSGLTLGTDNNLYGTCTFGGANGFGVVYKLTLAGVFTTLHAFSSAGGDGFEPAGPPIQASDGNFYGVTQFGGASGFGTVYKITLAGTVTTLHSFTGADGDQPLNSLYQGSDGSLYGTTEFGGANTVGEVFKMTLAGVVTVLHNFNVTDGSGPECSIIQGKDGNYYGTTSNGGTNSVGTIFRVTPTGGFTSLHSFTSGATGDGVSPVAGLIQATNGTFYGVVAGGGTGTGFGNGTLYKMSAAGVFTLLYSFDGTTSANPVFLVQNTNGLIYGDTTGGGFQGLGVAFSLNIGAGAFVNLGSTSGRVGSRVNIFGQGFTASSVVKFGGVAAITVTRQGTTFLTATVPAGAITGKVTVTTGATTLTSAQTYIVHDSWSSAAALPTARQGAAAGAIGGKIYVVGGATNSAIVSVNEIYSPITNTWSTGASLPTARWAVAYAVVNNILYVIGGSDSSNTLTNVVEAYDPSSNTWSTKSPMPTARNSITAAVENGKIYVVGGFGNGMRLSTVESYDPVANMWTTEAPLLVAKSYPATGLLSTTIVSAGGFESTNMVTGDNEGYNSTNNSWSNLTADPTARQASCSSSISGLFYVAGGANNTNVIATNESFRLTGGIWTTLTPMPTAAVIQASATLNNVLYCIGGSNNGSLFLGTVFNNVQIYQP